jgi:hypothetical protein
LTQQILVFIFTYILCLWWVQLMTWEGLTDGLDAYLNTFMSYLPQMMVIGCRFLLRAHLCWSCRGLRLAQPGGPTARVSVLPFLHEEGRRSSFWNEVILLKYRRWTMSKKTLSQIKKCPVFVDKEIQNLKVKEGLTFPEAWKRFIVLKPKTINKSYLSVLCLQSGVYFAKQTSASPRSKETGSTNTSTHVSISTQTEADTDTTHSSSVPCIQMQPNHSPSDTLRLCLPPKHLSCNKKLCFRSCSC